MDIQTGTSYDDVAAQASRSLFGQKLRLINSLHFNGLNGDIQSILRKSVESTEPLDSGGTRIWLPKPASVDELSDCLFRTPSARDHYIQTQKLHYIDVKETPDDVAAILNGEPSQTIKKQWRERLSKIINVEHQNVKEAIDRHYDSLIADAERDFTQSRNEIIKQTGKNSDIIKKAEATIASIDSKQNGRKFMGRLFARVTGQEAKEDNARERAQGLFQQTFDDNGSLPEERADLESAHKAQINALNDEHTEFQARVDQKYEQKLSDDGLDLEISNLPKPSERDSLLEMFYTLPPAWRVHNPPLNLGAPIND